MMAFLPCRAHGSRHDRGQALSGLLLEPVMKQTSCLAILLLLLGSPVWGAEPPEGTLPVGADGKPLNLDFETGTLKDWTAEGDAFAGQPIKGDTVAAAPRRHEEPAPGAVLDRHLRAQAATSRRARSPRCRSRSRTRGPRFLVGGGPHPTTCVELVRKDTGEVFFRASGHGRGGPAPRGRRPAAAQGQGDLHPRRGQAHRPLGPRQLRRLPLPRRASRPSPRPAASRRRPPTSTSTPACRRRRPPRR